MRLERECVYAHVLNGHTEITCFIIYFLKQIRNFIFWVNLASLLDPFQFSQYPRRIIWNNWVATNISTFLTGESKLQHSENVIYRYDLQHQLVSDTYSFTIMWNYNDTCIVILMQGASVHSKSRFVQMTYKLSMCYDQNGFLFAWVFMKEQASWTCSEDTSFCIQLLLLPSVYSKCTRCSNWMIFILCSGLPCW